jgi:prepilin-type N-terminal cleavage/methylation domain-containing protein
MTQTPKIRSAEAGFSLIEMMIALIVLGFVMGSAISVFRSQSRNFTKGGTRMELTQNIRYTMSTVDRVLRTLGAGTGTGQPMLVYAGNDVITFNADYASTIQDGVAVYINPNLPATSDLGLTTATPITIPNTAISYPVANYFWGGGTPSRAETISLYFQLDAATPDPNDYMLMERINNTAPELVARNLRAYPGRPFFEYWYDSTATTGVVTFKQLATASIPLRHTVIGGVLAPNTTQALADFVRTVRINVTVTNGDLADLMTRQVSTMVQVPNNGLTYLKTCGDIPLQTGALTTDTVGQGSGGVRLQWTLSPDELGGERDIGQYNVYYRLAAGVNWTPLLTQAPGFNPYSKSATLMPDSTYIFAVAAQDCSPAESPYVTSPATRLQP